jgi:thiol-disulfide isomerase/thioredoxin
MLRASTLIAESTVAEGAAVFQVELSEPRVFFVRSSGRNGGGVNIIVAPGEDVTITGTREEPRVTGAALQELYEKFVVKPQLDYMATFRQAMREENRQGREVAEVERELKAMKEAAVERAIKEHSNSLWGALTLYLNAAYVSPMVETLYGELSGDAKDTFYGREIGKSVQENRSALVGERAPGFTARDSTGKEYTLEGLLRECDYLLIDFWASWCQPCRRAIPEVKEFARKYAGKGLKVLSISTDKDRNAWLKAMQEEQMPWLNLLDETSVSARYGVKTIPSVFLVDANGTVLFGKLYGQAVGARLAGILGE